MAGPRDIKFALRIGAETEELVQASLDLERSAFNMEAAKRASGDLGTALARLEARSADLADTLGGPSASSIAETEQDLKRLEKQLQETGDETGEFAKQIARSRAQLEKSKKILVENEVAIEGLEEKTKDAIRSQRGLAAELKGGEVGARGMANAVGLVGGALAGGFAAGTLIAKRAGVDFTETQRTMNQALDTGATAINNFAVALISRLAPALEQTAAALDLVNIETAEAGEVTVNLHDAARDLGLELTQANLPAIKRHQRELREMASATADAETQIDQAASALNLLGIRTQRFANAEAEAFRQALEKLDQSGLRPSAAGLDALRLRFRGLADDGIALDSSMTFLAEKFDLLGKTQAEVNAETAKASAAFKAADEAIQTSITGGQTFNDVLADQAEKRREAAAQVVLQVENEIALQGLTDARAVALGEALRTEIAITDASTQEKIALEVAASDRIAELRLSLVELSQTANVAEVESFRNRVNSILEIEKASASLRKEQNQAITDFETETADALLANEQGNIEAEGQLRKQGLQAGLAAIQGAFGERKEVQIAQAIISTWEGAQASYSSLAPIPIVGPALGAVAAALAVKAGFDRVKAIKSSNPGSGGGGGGGSVSQISTGGASFAGAGGGRAASTALAGSSAELAAPIRSAAGVGVGGGPEVGGGTTVINVEGSFSTPPSEFVRAFSRESRVNSNRVEARVRGGRSKKLGGL